MNKKQQAKRLLRHYLGLALGGGIDPDVATEIEDIVDLIIDAARERDEHTDGTFIVIVVRNNDTYHKTEVIRTKDALEASRIVSHYTYVEYQDLRVAEVIGPLESGYR